MSDIFSFITSMSAMGEEDLKIFVKNIPETATSDQLQDFFSNFGVIENIEFLSLFSEMLVQVDFSKVHDSKGLMNGQIEFCGNQLEIKKVPSDIDDLIHNVKNSNKFNVRRLCFGNLVSDEGFHCYYDDDGQDILQTPQPKLVVNFNQGFFTIYFALKSNLYRLKINFRDLKDRLKIVKNKNNLQQASTKENNKYIIVLEMKTPPRIWALTNHNKGLNRFLQLVTKSLWRRVTHLCYSQQSNYNLDKLKSNGDFPVETCDLPEHILFGKWMSVGLEFCFTRAHERAFFSRMLNELMKYNILDDPIVYKTVQFKHKSIFTQEYIKNLWDYDSEIAYFLECLLSHNLLSYASINESFLVLVKKTPKDAIMKIFEYIWVTKEKVYNAEVFIQKNMKSEASLPFINNNCIYKIPSHCALIKKAVITPSKIYLVPPMIETTNRIIRKFSQVKQGFLRVVFADEDLSKVGSNIEECKLIYNRIYTVLRNGLKIGHQKYEFLAFSSSQLREHSCWFYCSTEDKSGTLITCEAIRNWMGDFSNITTVAKFAARMGQCFSTTVDSEKVNVESVELISDVEKNGKVYSDGVGTISYSLMKQITNTLNLQIVPSAIQFRFGGAKGVLSLNMELKTPQINLRPSQIKFESKHNILEIVRIANYSPCYLNRQIITLLTTLGVTDQVFIRMQENMISELNSINQKEIIAIRLLSKNSDEYGVTQSACELIKAGFMRRRDPYLLNILQLFRATSLRDLKKKSRIHVERGAVLMGILDETNTLKENEIYLQISNPQKPQKSQVMVGECAVMRNPCFHPGDVRVVQAVNNENLSHIINCVVFSQKGECIPELCSGGDLDGDLYS